MSRIIQARRRQRNVEYLGEDDSDASQAFAATEDSNTSSSDTGDYDSERSNSDSSDCSESDLRVSSSISRSVEKVCSLSSSEIENTERSNTVMPERSMAASGWLNFRPEDLLVGEGLESPPVLPSNSEVIEVQDLILSADEEAKRSLSTFSQKSADSCYETRSDLPKNQGYNSQTRCSSYQSSNRSVSQSIKSNYSNKESISNTDCMNPWSLVTPDQLLVYDEAIVVNEVGSTVHNEPHKMVGSARETNVDCDTESHSVNKDIEFHVEACDKIIEETSGSVEEINSRATKIYSEYTDAPEVVDISVETNDDQVLTSDTADIKTQDACVVQSTVNVNSTFEHMRNDFTIQQPAENSDTFKQVHGAHIDQHLTTDNETVGKTSDVSIHQSLLENTEKTPAAPICHSSFRDSESLSQQDFGKSSYNGSTISSQNSEPATNAWNAFALKESQANSAFSWGRSRPSTVNNRKYSSRGSSNHHSQDSAANRSSNRVGLNLPNSNTKKKHASPRLNGGIVNNSNLKASDNNKNEWAATTWNDTPKQNNGFAEASNFNSWENKTIQRTTKVTQINHSNIAGVSNSESTNNVDSKSIEKASSPDFTNAIKLKDDTISSNNITSSKDADVKSELKPEYIYWSDEERFADAEEENESEYYSPYSHLDKKSGSEVQNRTMQRKITSRHGIKGYDIAHSKKPARRQKSDNWFVDVEERKLKKESGGLPVDIQAKVNNKSALKQESDSLLSNNEYVDADEGSAFKQEHISMYNNTKHAGTNIEETGPEYVSGGNDSWKNIENDSKNPRDNSYKVQCSNQDDDTTLPGALSEFENQHLLKTNHDDSTSIANKVLSQNPCDVSESETNATHKWNLFAKNFESQQHSNNGSQQHSNNGSQQHSYHGSQGHYYSNPEIISNEEKVHVSTEASPDLTTAGTSTLDDSDVKIVLDDENDPEWYENQMVFGIPPPDKIHEAQENMVISEQYYGTPSLHQPNSVSSHAQYIPAFYTQAEAINGGGMNLTYAPMVSYGPSGPSFYAMTYPLYQPANGHMTSHDHSNQTGQHPNNYYYPGMSVRYEANGMVYYNMNSSMYPPVYYQ